MFAMHVSTNTGCKTVHDLSSVPPKPPAARQPCCVLGWTDSVTVTLKAVIESIGQDDRLWL